MTDDRGIHERTAPRRPEDCPSPRYVPGEWQKEHRLAGPFKTPEDAIGWAWSLEWSAHRLREQVALSLMDEGRPADEVAEIVQLKPEEVRDLWEQNLNSQQRLDYSRAYYERHPDRVAGEYYPVEDDDPQLPEGAGFSTRNRYVDPAAATDQETAR